MLFWALAVASALTPSLAAAQRLLPPSAAVTTPAPTPAAQSFMLAEPPSREGVRRVALVTSGAISLGAYEAGLNWALVRYIRQQHVAGSRQLRFSFARPMQITTATGASAGNINALLSVATYCKSAEAEANDNLFYSTWLPIGLHELTTDYLGEDGLLSRRAIHDKALEVMDDLLRPQFEACDVPLGVTLTPVNPDEVKFGTVNIGHLRETVLMRAHGQRGRLRLQPLVPKRESSECAADGICDMQRRLYGAAIGRRVELPYDPQLALDARNVASVVEASSAVQFVFGARAVNVCRDDGKPGEACTGGGTLRTEYFTDGGFFDNTPLGLAIALGSTRADKKSTDEYIYIDPDNVDPAIAIPPEAETEAREPHPHSLLQLGKLAGHLFAAARTYELATVSRYLASYGSRVRGTMRLHPVIGSHLSHFAAFTAKAFRQYDYDVGIADGLVFVARRICADPSTTTPEDPTGWRNGPQLRDCMPTVLKALIEGSGLTATATTIERDGPLVIALVNRVLEREGQATLTWPEVPELSAKSLPVLHAIDRAVLHTDAEAREHRKHEAATLWDEIIGNDGFEEIFDYLRQHGFEDTLKACKVEAYCSERDKEQLSQWLADPGAQMRALAKHLSERQLSIETGRVAHGRYAEGNPRPVALVRGLLRQETLIAGFRMWNGGSGTGYWNLLPYSVAVDAIRGGGEGAYRAHLSFGSRYFGLVPQLGAWVRKESMSSTSWTAFLHADLLASLEFSRKSFLGPTLELGAQYLYGFASPHASQVGGELGLALFAEKVRITVVQYPDPNQTVVFIGVGDVPGLLQLASDF